MGTIEIGKRISGAVLTALILFTGCARPLPPPGGPADQLPPIVEWTSPAPDSVGVDLRSEIRVRFSEAMDRQTVERAIFISPAFPVQPKLRWKGRELKIQVPDSLRRNRTYIVTIGSEGADVSRNRMRSSYSFAFSTGDQLSQGEIRGYLQPTGNLQPYIWVYDLQERASPNPGEDSPDYVTQPGQGGRFEIHRISAGKYRVFGFLDQNRDKTFTPDRDLLAVPAGDLTLSDDHDVVKLASLRPVLRDTIGPRFLSVRTTDFRHMLVRFDEPVSSDATVRAGKLEVLAVHLDTEDSSRVWVLTSPQVAGEMYGIDLRGIRDRAGNPLGSSPDVEVKGDAEPDRRKPEIVSTDPVSGSEYVAPDVSLKITFSEAMSPSAGEDLWVASDTTSAPAGQVRWTAPNQVVFSPTEALKSGETHRFQVNPGYFADATGNLLGKPAKLHFQVSSPQDLGKIDGRVEPSPNRIVLSAVRLESPYREYEATIAPGDSLYHFPGMIPGSYRISGFLDRNNDGLWEQGSAVPFVPSEPLAEFPDTLEVRARWATVAERPFATPAPFKPLLKEE